MLPQSLRVPSRLILPLLRRGKKIREGSLELVFERTSAKSAFACIVPVKVDKRATKRNRMKRLVREAVALLLPEITVDFIGIIVVRGKIPDMQQEVVSLVRNALIKAGLHQ
ncbi:MAG: ribonuclease P protein component [Patescibacteria group bacterium]